MLLVACSSSNNTGIRVGKISNVNGLPPSKDNDIIGYHDNELIIASNNSEGVTFDIIMHDNEIYIYDTFTLNGDSLVQDFIPTDNGYIYTYRKLVKEVFEFSAVQSKYRGDTSMTYEHTDLNKIPRFFKIDSAVYTIIEVSEKEPSKSIYKYIDGDQEVFYSSDNPVVSTKLYPSEHGFIFVEYIGDQSKLMEVDGTNVKSMLFIKGEVFDVSSLDGHTYFLILDENQ